MQTTTLRARPGVNPQALCVSLSVQTTTLSSPIGPLFRVQAKVSIEYPEQRNSSALTSLANASPFHPREDRAGARLSGDNAQAVLPPNACVFVAK